MQERVVRSNVMLGTCVYQFLQRVGGSKRHEPQECPVTDFVKEELDQQDICMEVEHISRSGMQCTCYGQRGHSL